MKLKAGFVGFDGTESKRAIPAIYQVKEAEGIAGDMNYTASQSPCKG
jgi:hypothetical protein